MYNIAGRLPKNSSKVDLQSQNTTKKLEQRKGELSVIITNCWGVILQKKVYHLGVVHIKSPQATFS